MDATRTCTVDGCAGVHHARGLCDPHYRRQMPGTCSIDGCARPHEAKGLCKAHRQRLVRGRDPFPPIRGNGRFHWRGEAVGYGAAHERLRRRRGLATQHQCVCCGKPGREWAYDHTDPSPLIGLKGRPYSTDINRYMPLCASCHRLFDLAIQKGHIEP